jgi:hypothetical protein
MTKSETVLLIGRNVDGLSDQTLHKLKLGSSTYVLMCNLIVLAQDVSTGVVSCIDQHELTRPF